MNSQTTLPILAYHSISQPQTPADAQLTTSPARFAEHLDWLAGAGYTALTVAQWWSQRQRLPERTIVLTFDDGYADFLDAALPQLSRHGFAATLFVVAGFVGQHDEWQHSQGDPRRRLLDWPALAELPEAHVEIGAHSQHHPHLDLIPIAQARNEIVESKATLEDRLGRPIANFAYPYGASTRTVRRLVAEAGFTTACAVVDALHATHDSPLAMARLVMHDGITAAHLGATLSRDAPSPPQRLWRRTLTEVYRPYRRLRAALAPLNGMR